MTGEARKARRRKWGRRHNPDGTMTLIEHLHELRYRLTIAAVAVVIGAVLGFIWFEHGFLGIPNLGSLLTQPYCALPPEIRLNTGTEGCQLLQTQPFEAFMIQMKIGMAAGAVAMSPIWLYQLWAFITPGLYTKERRFASVFVFFASILFVLGAVLAAVVIPKALGFLTSFGGGMFVTALTADAYIDFVLTLLLIFGVSFELPLLVVMLNRAGVVTHKKLSGWRRGIIFALFAFAAIATPGQDPFSMLALAIALVILFEIAVQIARVHDKRRKARDLAEGWVDRYDDEDDQRSGRRDTADAT